MGVAIVLILIVRIGVPVALLFAWSYWLEQRHEPGIRTSGTATNGASQIGHGKTPDVDSSDGELSSMANGIGLDGPPLLEMAGNETGIGNRRPVTDSGKRRFRWTRKA